MQSTTKDRKQKREPTTGKNPIAQRLITANGWKLELAKEMNRAKLPIDPQKLL